VEAVDPMVRPVDGLLRTRLEHPEGFASSGVTVVDPAVGTGTFLFRVIDRIAEHIAADIGLAISPAWDVHHANLFDRVEQTTGIVPFGRLVDQVMKVEPYKSARRVFWVVDKLVAKASPRASRAACFRPTSGVTGGHASAPGV
jgi:hypothetical protein